MVAPSFSTGNPILDFIYILLNGISEVPLISSPLTGLLILTGVFIASKESRHYDGSIRTNRSSSRINDGRIV